VLTGGEPTIQDGLADFAATIKEMGFALKLDTNGYRPDVLEELLAAQCVDYIAMDIKTTWNKYSQAAGVNVDIPRLVRSVKLLKEAAVGHEFRTTCVPKLVTEDDIVEIGGIIGNDSCYTLQQFQPCDTLNPEYAGIEPYSPQTLRHFCESVSARVRSCRVIGV
jgi:pyruvate formate lyase activating enzyme